MGIKTLPAVMRKPECQLFPVRKASLKTSMRRWKLPIKSVIRSSLLIVSGGKGIRVACNKEELINGITYLWLCDSFGIPGFTENI